MMLRLPSCLAVLVVFGVGLLATTAQAVTIRTVFLTGDEAPGTNGARFRSGWGPVINNAGQVAFSGGLLREGTIGNSDDDGIWSEGGGTLELIARGDDPAPGFPGFPDATFVNLGQPVLSGAGQVAFVGGARGTNLGGSNDVIWAGTAGNLRKVARESEPLPGPPEGMRQGTLYTIPPVINGDGDTAFFASVGYGGSARAGIFGESAGVLAPIITTYDAEPQFPDGVKFDDSASFGAMNDQGEIAFATRLWGNVTYYNDEAVASTHDGFHIVARKGDPAPGMPAGTKFSSFGAVATPSINNAGQVVFCAETSGRGVGYRYGVWSGDAGNLTFLGSHRGAPVINAEGKAAVIGGGVWSEGFGTWSRVAGYGEHAVGAPDEVLFESFSELVLNAAGQAAFLGKLKGAGVTSDNDYGIWAQDPSGTLRLIAREGDSLTVAADDTREIRSLGFRGNSGNEDGRASGFDDLGRVAFSAVFTDRFPDTGDRSSGVFVSNAVAVPEPSTLALLGIGAVALFGCAWRRKRRTAAITGKAD